jgi:hypothetical protein
MCETEQWGKRCVPQGQEGFESQPQGIYSGICVYAFPPIKSAAATTGCSEGKVFPALNAFDVVLIDLWARHSKRGISTVNLRFGR